MPNKSWRSRYQPSLKVRYVPETGHPLSRELGRKVAYACHHKTLFRQRCQYLGNGNIWSNLVLQEMPQSPYISLSPLNAASGRRGLYAAPQDTSKEGRKMDGCGRRLRIALATVVIILGLNAMAVVSGIAEHTYAHILGTGTTPRLAGADKRQSGRTLIAQDKMARCAITPRSARING